MARRAVEFTFDGDVSLSRGVNSMREDMPAILRDEATKEAQGIVSAVNRHYVPEDQGDLKRSGRVVETPSRVGAGDVEVEIVYGEGLPDPRALVIELYPQLAPPSWRIAGSVTFNPRGRGPRYLGRAVEDAQRSFPGRVAATVRNYLRKVW